MNEHTTPAVEAPEVVVEIRKLWTVFESDQGDQVVHRDLDLTIVRGEVLSLVGGSGTGKTVLLRQILGLEHPDKGEVRVLGVPPTELSAKGAARVGMLFPHGARGDRLSASLHPRLLPGRPRQARHGSAS